MALWRTLIILALKYLVKTLLVQIAHVKTSMSDLVMNKMLFMLKVTCLLMETSSAKSLSTQNLMCLLLRLPLMVKTTLMITRLSASSTPIFLTLSQDWWAPLVLLNFSLSASVLLILMLVSLNQSTGMKVSLLAMVETASSQQLSLTKILFRLLVTPRVRSSLATDQMLAKLVWLSKQVCLTTLLLRTT